MAANKAYDGTTSATLTSCTLSGVVGGDVVSCTGHGDLRLTASVGTGKTVTVSGLTLTGAAAGNYTLATPDGDDDGGDHRADRHADGGRGEQDCTTGRRARRSRAAR